MNSLTKALLIIALLMGLATAGKTAIKIDVDIPELVQQLAGLKVEGKGYFYYYHDASEGDGQTNSFELSRLYMGAKYHISDEFTVRYLTDIAHHQHNTGKLEVFTKYAYINWKLTDDLNLIMGLQGTNNWSKPEKAWGYRSIRKSPMEAFGGFWGDVLKDYTHYLKEWAADSASTEESTRLKRLAAGLTSSGSSKMGSSADLGIGIKYKPSKKSYLNLLIRNGTGYKKAENDMFKNIQLRTGMYMMDKTIHITGFVEVEPWRGIDEDGAVKGYMNTQWDVMVSYSQKGKFTVGVDINSKSFDGIQTVDALGTSIFGNVYILPKKLKALARYDIYSTGFNDAEVKAGDGKLESDGSLLIVGLDYKPHKKISIIPNFQMTFYEDSDMDAVRSVYVHMVFKL